MTGARRPAAAAGAPDAPRPLALGATPLALRHPGQRRREAKEVPHGGAPVAEQQLVLEIVITDEIDECISLNSVNVLRTSRACRPRLRCCA